MIDRYGCMTLREASRRQFVIAMLQIGWAWRAEAEIA
jgi:hypothetical protein